MITLLASLFWGDTIAPLQPSKHRLTNVDTAVIDDIRLYHLIAIGFHNLCQRPTEEVVTHVSKVERLVRVRRRVLNHNKRTVLSH